MEYHEPYDISHMRVRPKHEDYRAFYLGDLASRMVHTCQKDGRSAEPVQTEYERLTEEDRAVVDKHLKTHQEEQ